MHKTHDEQQVLPSADCAGKALAFYCSTHWLLRLLIARTMVQIIVWDHEHVEPSL